MNSEPLSSEHRSFNSVDLHPSISASSIEYDILVVEPTVTPEMLPDFASQWIKKHRRFWPEDLNASQLTQNMKLYFAPFWVVNGNGSGTWNAQIGTLHTEYAEGNQKCLACDGKGVIITADPRYEYERKMGSGYAGISRSTCSVCGGEGKILAQRVYEYTKWQSASGQVQSDVRDHVVPASDVMRLVPLWSATTFKSLKETEAREEAVLSFDLSQNKAYDVGYQVIRETIQQAAYDQARMSNKQVSDLMVNGFQQSHTVSVWLYPMYSGYYDYEGEKLELQIDAINGNSVGEVPLVVRERRQARREFIENIVKATISLILVFAIFLLSQTLFIEIVAFVIGLFFPSLRGFTEIISFGVVAVLGILIWFRRKREILGILDFFKRLFVTSGLSKKIDELLL